MITKLICQLPDIDAFGRKGRLSFDPENVKDLGWVTNDWRHKFNPDHVQDITGTAWTLQVQHRTHPRGDLTKRS